jgi:adenosylhomocysteine nucleosidase
VSLHGKVPLLSQAGVVCGMVSEAACFRGLAWAPKVRVSGGRIDQTRALARALVAEGVTGLVSCGVAGGLDPDLMPGTLVLASEVVSHNGEVWPTDPGWRQQIVEALAPRDGLRRQLRLLGSDVAVLDVHEKARCLATTGAHAIDMESHGVAEVARESGLPFVVLRWICDPATHALPGFVAAGLGPDGKPRITPILQGLFREPSALPSLLRLGRWNHHALRTAQAQLVFLSSQLDRKTG